MTHQRVHIWSKCDDKLKWYNNNFNILCAFFKFSSSIIILTLFSTISVYWRQRWSSDVSVHGTRDWNTIRAKAKPAAVGFWMNNKWKSGVRRGRKTPCPLSIIPDGGVDARARTHTATPILVTDHRYRGSMYMWCH